MQANTQASPATFFPSAIWQRALRDSDLDARAKTLGLWMSVYADPKTGEMFPSIASLRLLIVREDDGRPVSESTIKRMRRLLVHAGWIELVSKGTGRGKASVYRLSFPAEKQVTEAGENGSENGSDPLAENGSGVTHQVQHEVHVPPTGVLSSPLSSKELREDHYSGSSSSCLASLKPASERSSSSEPNQIDKAAARWAEVFREVHDRAPLPEDHPVHSSAWDYENAARQLRFRASVPW
jgi:hypothetical protein